MISAKQEIQNGRHLTWFEVCYGAIFVPDEREWGIYAHFGHHMDRLVKLGHLQRRTWVVKNIACPSQEETQFRRMMIDAFPGSIECVYSVSSDPNAPIKMELSVVNLPERKPQWEAFLGEHDVPDFRQLFMPAPENAGEGGPEKSGKELRGSPPP